MLIIPVIDVQFGQAVRAVGGQRDSYAPLVTPLASSTHPADVARGLLNLYPFKTMYTADLDGIEGRGTQAKLCEQLVTACPTTEFWIDDGAHTPQDIGARLAEPQLSAVIGSESISSALALEGPMMMFPGRIVLSLDFGKDGFIGPTSLLDDTRHWPLAVIVMTLSKVGANAGPDVTRIKDILRRAPKHTRVFAAGGVRTLNDLKALRDHGVAGALVSSALHSGQIKTGDLVEAAGW
jgi:HisA/HisF family protein